MLSGFAVFAGAMLLSVDPEFCVAALAFALPLLVLPEEVSAPAFVELLTPTDGKLAPTLVPLPTDIWAKAGEAADKATAIIVENTFNDMIVS